MKRLSTLLIVSLLALSAGEAWGQYGLYGSPDVLSLPNNRPLAVAQAPGAVPPGVPAGPGAPIPPPPAPPLVPNALPQAPPPVPAPAPNGMNQPVPAPGAPNVMNQLLGENGAVVPSPSDCGTCGPTAPACDAPCCFPVADCPWFLTVEALGLTRSRGHRLWTTYETNNEANQLMNTDDISEDWRWGGEIRFGRRFCCGTMGLEAVYWSVDRFDSMASMTNPNGVSTTLTAGWVEMQTDPAATADLWFDNAAGHRLWLEDEVHNVELNFLRNPFSCAIDHGWEGDFVAGVRYFRFADSLTFGSVANSYWWGEDPSQEIYLNDRVKNDLVGFQLGFTGGYRFNPSWKVFVAPKFGIYNNHMRHYFNMALGDGTGALPAAGSGQTGTYPVSSSDDSVSFLTEIDLGVQWRFACHWSAQIGYRVVAITGMALANEQIPQQLVDIPEIADIDHTGDLILHGAFVGITYEF